MPYAPHSAMRTYEYYLESHKTLQVQDNRCHIDKAADLTGALPGNTSRDWLFSTDTASIQACERNW